jgi:predicted phosphoadenosine phosphosulfate sulfurtransferase
MARSSQYSPTGAGTRIYSERTVLQAAYDRIEWLFGEFDNVVVRVSGGKDSTVIYWIALEVARHLGRLPLKVYWLDQEAEWQSTVDIVGDWMRHPDVDPIWLQVPFRIFNAASQTDHWLYAWDPAAEGKWVHAPDPLARRENVYGTDRFVELFGAASAHEFGGRKACSITGVRAQESPNRRKGLTSFKTYKWATWGGKEPDWPDNYQFHPLYDWTFVDVWKCILDHGWEYNRLYDTQYRYGVHLQKMRVSNLHHETAVHSLFHLQEFEPETYERLAARIEGVDAAGKLGVDDYFVSEVPFMFDGWRDYRDYLLVHLVDPEYRPGMAKTMNEHDRKLPPGKWLDKAHRMHVQAILTCDWESVKLDNFFQSPEVWQVQRANKPQWKTVEEVPVPS